MSDKRYEANIIRTTAVEPANNLETTSAPGVWSIDEVVELQKKNKWPTVGNVVTDVDDVFSTYLNNDGSSNQVITNGIDLSGEGGLVWGKSRNLTEGHFLVDSERGTGSNNNFKYVRSDTAAQEVDLSNRSISSFNSNGFTFQGADAQFNASGNEYVYWTFRKAPKFFDVVTYTGNFTAGTTISHNLGQTPGMIIFKDTSNTRNWYIYHRSLGKSTFLSLDQTIASFSNTFMLNNTDPTSTEFTLGEATNTNANGATYVAYLFAHNNNDGGFGPDQDADIIKCGSYTNSGSGVEVNLGFEPQFMMFKRTDATSNWSVVDEMRGIPTPVTSAGDNSTQLRWNLSNAENAEYNPFPTPTGFKVVGSAGGGGGGSGTFVYMAIRRGPLAQPTSATNVFAIDTSTSDASSGDVLASTFPVDAYLYGRRDGGSHGIMSRLTRTRLLTDSTSAEGSLGSYVDFDRQTGIKRNALLGNASTVDYMWRRAPGFFDVVCYTGASGDQTINHNLGVVPEMIWIKKRSESSYYGWPVYWGTTGNLHLNQNYSSAYASSNAVNHSNISATTFEVDNGNTEVNDVGETHIAYLFASLAGVSKVGSYTGDGTEDGSKVIDCGFSSGARFVLIKRTDSAGGWQFFDTVRGLVAGNDPRLQLNDSSAETTGYDFIDPHNSGFIVGVSTISKNAFNVSSANYIFYAIA